MLALKVMSEQISERSKLYVLIYPLQLVLYLSNIQITLKMKILTSSKSHAIPLLCQDVQTGPRFPCLLLETSYKVFPTCISQRPQYFSSPQSIMSHPSQALHIKLFSCCSLRQLLGIKIALRQNLEKQLKAWCLGGFCNYELIMFWSCADSCLWHWWMRAVCRDKDRNLPLLDCSLNSDFELLFVCYHLIYLLVLYTSWSGFWPGDGDWDRSMSDRAACGTKHALGLVQRLLAHLGFPLQRNFTPDAL